MTLSDFDFNLPEQLIAQYPHEQRSGSRLLVYDENKGITDSLFQNIDVFLPEGAGLVLNDTRVFPSRLIGQKKSGAKVEIFLLAMPVESIGSNPKVKALAKPMRKLKEGDEIFFNDDIVAKILMLEKDLSTPEAYIEFNKPLSILTQWFEKNGYIPLPPYIKREELKAAGESDDKETYQTVYAKNIGSVAAPTAGLHFTDEVLNRLKAKKIDVLYVTHHVGAGTFLPVKDEDVNLHKMHQESFYIKKSVFDKIREKRQANQKVICVGTTSFRCLESLSILGDKNFEKMALLCDTWQDCDLFVRPQNKSDFYRPFLIDALITNFHQPKSTLFMLICALLGYEQACSIYRHAVGQEYRFFSYGDSNLYWLPVANND